MTWTVNVGIVTLFGFVFLMEVAIVMPRAFSSGVINFIVLRFRHPPAQYSVIAEVSVVSMVNVANCSNVDMWFVLLYTSAIRIKLIYLARLLKREEYTELFSVQ